MAGPGGQEVGRVSVRVVPDTDDFRRRLREQLERETEGMEANVGVNVDLDADGVRERMRLLMLELRAQAAGGVDINVGVDRNQLAGISQGFRGLSTGANGASGSMRGLTQNIFIMLAVLALIGPLVTLVGGLLAGLPSLLLGFGVAAAAVALGFDGIKKAAAGFSAPIVALKESLSARFEDRLTPIFDKLAGALPKFQGGLLRVADGVSDLIGSFTDVVTSASGIKQVNEILRGTGLLFSQLKPFVRDFSSGLLGLASAGAGSFTLLSSTMRNFSTKFNEVVQRVTSDGSFYNAMKGLSNVADGLGDAFNVVFEAAIRSMPKLGETLKVVLQQFGIGLAEAMPGLVAFGDLVFGVIGFASRVLGGFFKGVGPALTRFADGMTSSLARSGDNVSDFFAKVGEKVGVFLDWFREQVPLILNTVKDFFTALSGGDTGNDSTGTQFGDKIRSGFEAIRQFFEDHGEEIKSAIKQIADAAFAAAGVVSSIVGAFITLGEWVGIAKDKIQGFFDAVAGFVSDPVTPIVRNMAIAFDFVQTAVGNALNAVSGFAGSAVAALQSAGSQMLSAIQSAWDAIVSTVRQKITEVVSAVTELGGQIKSALSGIAGEMVSIGAQIIQGLINGIQSMASSVASAAASVVSGAVAAAKSALGIHSPSRVFANFGELSAVGYINGLEDRSGDVDKAGDKFGSRVKDSLTKQVPTIDQAWADALEQSKLGDVPKNFLEATGNNLLSDIGISTDGALGELVKQITQNNFVSKPTYIVQDLDEAQRKEKRRQEKESLQYTRR